MHYKDYVWKSGLPYGINHSESKEGITYKVLSDPYHRVVFIEQYRDGSFVKIVYDSRLLNFRKLNPQEQTAWERTIRSETESEIVSEVRNQDDQLIIVETMSYDEQGLCKSCRLHSPQGFFLSEHRMNYKLLGHEFDGVVLYDSNEHVVMVKKYLFDEESGQFSDLLEEKWEGFTKEFTLLS